MELVDQVMGGWADDYLPELAEAIKDRQRFMAKRLIRQLNQGDLVKFNGQTRPAYLQGVEAEVIKVVGDKVEVKLSTAAGRFPADTPIKVPAILVELTS